MSIIRNNRTTKSSKSAQGSVRNISGTTQRQPSTTPVSRKSISGTAIIVIVLMAVLVVFVTVIAVTLARPKTEDKFWGDQKYVYDTTQTTCDSMRLGKAIDAANYCQKGLDDFKSCQSTATSKDGALNCYPAFYAAYCKSVNWYDTDGADMLTCEKTGEDQIARYRQKQ